MTTTFTLEGAVLDAMLAFVSTNRSCTGQAILRDVLCEVTPDAVRLVATDGNILGLLQLTPVTGYRLDITCPAPTRLVLPIERFRSVLTHRGYAVQVAIHDDQVTMTAITGLSLTAPGAPGEDFPEYQRVLAVAEPCQPVAHLALNADLLGKFARFAKAMNVPPYLECGFSDPNGPIRVRIAGLPSFYGVCMPRQRAYTEIRPDWLLPPRAVPAVEPAEADRAAVPDANEPRLRLHDVQGLTLQSGYDDDGTVWRQFTVDAFAGEAPARCVWCGADLAGGWQCLTGGDAVCDRHVLLLPAETGDTPDAAEAATVLFLQRITDRLLGDVGADADGQVWRQVTVTAADPATPERCAGCGAPVTHGWLNLDTGETLCATHVVLSDAASETDAALSVAGPL